jgi:glycosyltransferase involved in cell wall biosynthesis
MCIIKNEADIIEQTLTAAATWCDHIYIFDNGSEDGTWELVQKLAARHPQIVLFKQDPKPFTDSLRAEIFSAYRHRSNEGDWWCRLDADEFYVDDPRVFLAKVPVSYNVVWTANLSYYFTDRDADLYRADASLYSDEMPVHQKCRYYINHWSEPRFFRYANDLVWSEGDGGHPAENPRTRVYPARVTLQHFAYRSPQQIEKRLRTRRPALDNGVFPHEAVPNWGDAIAQIRRGGTDSMHQAMGQASERHWANSWEERIVSAASLDFDAHDGKFNFNESLMPEIPQRRSATYNAFSRVKVAAGSFLRSKIRG